MIYRVFFIAASQVVGVGISEPSAVEKTIFRILAISHDFFIQDANKKGSNCLNGTANEQHVFVGCFSQLVNARKENDKEGLQGSPTRNVEVPVVTIIRMSTQRILFI